MDDRYHPPLAVVLLLRAIDLAASSLLDGPESIEPSAKHSRIDYAGWLEPLGQPDRQAVMVPPHLFGRLDPADSPQEDIPTQPVQCQS